MAALLHVCFLLTLLAPSAWTQSDTGSTAIVVAPTQSSVNTRVGCKVTICCQGNGLSGSWRPFGQRGDPIQNGTGGRIITETLVDSGNDDGFFFVSTKLTFTSIGTNDRGALTCAINRGSMMNALTQTYLVFVDPEPLALNVSTINISSYAVTERLTIPCNVLTCAQGVGVEFFKGDRSLGSGTLSDTAPSVYNLVITVDEDTPGLYACRATTTTPILLPVTEMFNITGTPLPAPETPETPVTMVTGTGPVQVTGGSPDTTQSTTTGSGVAASVRPVLLLVLLVLWCVLRP